jgi:hypothetical protein
MLCARFGSVFAGEISQDRSFRGHLSGCFKVSLADSTHALSPNCPGVRLGETGYKPIEMGFGRGQAIQVIEYKHALLPPVPLKIWWERSRVGSIARRIHAPRPSGRAMRVQICFRQICPTLGTNSKIRRRDAAAGRLRGALPVRLSSKAALHTPACSRRIIPTLGADHVSPDPAPATSRDFRCKTFRRYFSVSSNEKIFRGQIP